MATWDPPDGSLPVRSAGPAARPARSRGDSGARRAELVVGSRPGARSYVSGSAGWILKLETGRSKLSVRPGVRPAGGALLPDRGGPADWRYPGHRGVQLLRWLGTSGLAQV